MNVPGLIYGIPRETVAFAAGLRAGGARHWRVVACVLEAAGFGTWDVLALQMAADAWTRAATRRADDLDLALGVAVDRTRPVDPS